MNIKTLCLTGALVVNRYQYLRPEKERSNK